MARYKINDIEMPSVTEIIGQLNKGDALIQWAVNISVDKNDKAAWKERRDDTADLGTQLHNAIETYIKDKISGITPDIDKILFGYIPTFKQMFYQFLIWERETVLEWLASEQPIYNDIEMYAGTCDMIFISKAGKRVLCDLKTKNALYGDEDLQLAAYKDAWETLTKPYTVRMYDGVLREFSNKHVWKIEEISILKISRDFFDLEYKVLTDKYVNASRCFRLLTDFFYTRKSRRLKNNARAK